MSSKTRTVLTVTAVIILFLAAAGIAFVILDSNGVFDSLKERIAQSQTEAVTTAEYIHDDEEYNYNSDGTISSVVYYKDNVFNGRTDYAYLTNETYIIHYNADNEECASEKTTYNIEKKPVKYTNKENGTLVTEITYDYYDDMTTLKKQTEKNFAADGTESAEKQYYSEVGLLTKKCLYENGTLTEQTEYEYDESGEVVSENTVTGEVNEDESED